MAEEPRNSTQLHTKKDQNPTKFYSRFIFKAFLLALFCATLPFFLSQTPELANQATLIELLHLIFVGIAVSYGLFSRRNYDGGGGGGDGDSINDKNPYKILEVSSVFNVDNQESESEPLDDYSGDYKIQTWRNRYQMKSSESEFVIAKDHETRFVEKPLLLPVRSLNSKVSDSNSGEGNFGRWEKVRSKKELLKSLADDKAAVLPSPIPWRSRSSSSSGIESKPSIKNLDTVGSSSSFSSSPRKSTPLPKFPSESAAKSAEDTVKKQNLHEEFHPPPPPPPPPPPAFYNSLSRKEFHKTEPRESIQKPKFVDVSSKSFRKIRSEEFHPPPPPPPPPPEYYKSPPSKQRRNDRSSSGIRNSPKTWKTQKTSKTVKRCDPIVEWKNHMIEREDLEEEETSSFIDQRSYLGSKSSEEEEEVNGGNSGGEDGKDVDKKADEFIAKFREQIRLQRIESIKRSAAHKISETHS